MEMDGHESRLLWMMIDSSELVMLIKFYQGSNPQVFCSFMGMGLRGNRCGVFCTYM